MSNPRYSSGRDHIEAALEASCDTLVALEVIVALASCDRRGKEQATRAIKSLQRAISELRLAYDEHVSPLARGFVIAGCSAHRR